MCLDNILLCTLEEQDPIPLGVRSADVSIMPRQSSGYANLNDVQVNTKPGARKGKKAGKKKKDDPAVEHEDLDDDEEQAQHTQEVEDAAGQSP